MHWSHSVLQIRYHNETNELPTKCQRCVWRRGRVCTVGKCHKEVESISNDSDAVVGSVSL